MDLILSVGADKEDSIIDIGGGDARLVDALLGLDFKKLFVLDISAEALGKAKARLKSGAVFINWVESNVLEFDTGERFDIWHDRATFHFLTKKRDVVRYVEIADKLIKPRGIAYYLRCVCGYDFAVR